MTFGYMLLALFLYTYQYFPVAGSNYFFRVGECAVKVEHDKLVFHAVSFCVQR